MADGGQLSWHLKDTAVLLPCHTTKVRLLKDASGSLSLNIIRRLGCRTYVVTVFFTERKLHD